jgi:hypothetical protein
VHLILLEKCTSFCWKSAPHFVGKVQQHSDQP